MKLIIVLENIFFSLINFAVLILTFFRLRGTGHFRKIKSLKNLHFGKDAILILNGPSLDLAKISKNDNCIIMTVNNFHKNQMSKIHIDYLVVIDPEFYEESSGSSQIFDIVLNLHDKTELILGKESLKAEHLLRSINDKRIGSYFLKNNLYVSSSRIKTELHKSSNKFFNVASYALVILYYLGVRNVRIYGLDFSPGWKHAYNETNSPNSNTYDKYESLSGIWQYYSAHKELYLIQELYQNNNGYIKNCNMNTFVQAFEVCECE